VNSDSLILLCRLHWFPEQQRADFKTLVMMVTCILGTVYLLSLIYFQKLSKPGLRSQTSTSMNLTVLSTRTGHCEEDALSRVTLVLGWSWLVLSKAITYIKDLKTFRSCLTLYSPTDLKLAVLPKNEQKLLVASLHQMLCLSIHQFNATKRR
jgi:preprotein translocase subunit SecG